MSFLNKIKKRLHEILEVSKPNDNLSKAFDIFIVSLIILNVISVILETIESIKLQYNTLFTTFELFSVIIFTIEYILRIWVSTVDKKYKKPIIGRIHYILSFYMIVDLVAILPFYLPMIFSIDLRIIRIIRLIRIFRLFKVGRYSKALKLMINVFKSKKEELTTSIFIVIIILVISSTAVYYVEKDAQPLVFSNIPNAMWWGVAALSTTGYGDVRPITPLGKILGAIITITGVGLFALPAGIIASGFIDKIQNKDDKKRICPYCGKNINKK